MRSRNALSLAVAALFAVGIAVSMAAQEQKPTVQIPQAGVPQIATIEGQYVRAQRTTTRATSFSATGPPTSLSATSGCCWKWAPRCATALRASS